MNRPDYAEWMKQPLIWTERIRSRALVWTPDAHWFINDPLGPLPHAHDDATEIIYIAAGQMDIQVGESKQRVAAGDLLLMPPDRFHNYWLVGAETVCMYVLVVPNHKQARWRYKDFKPGAFEGHAPMVNVFAGQPIPCDERIAIQVRELAPGASTEGCVESVREKMIYVLEGAGSVQIERMSGELSPNDYQHIPATHRHRISNTGNETLKYLEFVCFDPTAPAAIRPEDAHLADT
ncbi:MAG: cupin domain-containing protein [Chloroflexi bacterium]|nr:cupin domain-containing protein [Chloroflexota bacterium]MCL5275912.1 cupin domain-containing protein [Chloroflexota bacterium]